MRKKDGNKNIILIVIIILIVLAGLYFIFRTTGFLVYTEEGNYTANVTLPNFTNLANQNIYVNQSLSYDINAEDADGISCFAVNDTAKFNIDCSGLLVNITGLNAGLYWVDITVNDTFNNATSSLISINVAEDLTSPSVTLLSPAEAYSTSSEGVSFEYQVSDANSIVNCSLMIDSAVSSTSFGVARDISRTFYVIVSAGTHTWGVNCFDEYNNLGSSGGRALTSTYSQTTTQTNSTSNTTTSTTSASTTTTTTEDLTAEPASTPQETPAPATTPAPETATTENTTAAQDKKSDSITGKTIGSNIINYGKNNLGLIIGIVLLIVLIIIFLVIRHRKKIKSSFIKK